MEIWKDIPWYEWLYKIDKQWNVKSLNKIDQRWNNRKEKILAVYYDKQWYKYSGLSKNKKRIKYKNHRLVLLTFIWESKLECNHKNWIKGDNRLENLEYCTRSENMLHSYNILNRKATWTWKFWKENPTSRAVKQYTKEWIFIKTWDCISEVSEKLNIERTGISKVCLWKRKISWWYKWKYFI